MLEEMLAYTAIGTEAQVRDTLARFVAQTKPDELMISGQIFNQTARLKSFEIAARAAEGLAIAAD